MKLHLKLLLSLLAGLIIVFSIFQVWQYRRLSGLIRESAAGEVEQGNALGARAVESLQQGVGRMIVDPLGRGDMEKFNRLLKELKGIPGLLEYSLFDREGVVKYSTDEQRLEALLPSEVKPQILGKKESFTRWAGQSYEAYQPHSAEESCLACHSQWKAGDNAGTSLLRFSAGGFNGSVPDREQAAAELQSALVWGGVWSSGAVLVILALLFYVLIEKYVRRPVTRFGDFMERFDWSLEQRVQWSGRDELGRLAEFLNSLLEQFNSVISGSEEAGIKISTSGAERIAGVERTSTALEKLGALVDQSAASAASADQLLQALRDRIAAADKTVGELGGTLAELKAAGLETAKIVKNIEEIAFQTHLLGINAAVEATRAGEAGAGFSVVAHEVRGLAARASDTARSICKKIDETVQRIGAGGEIAGAAAAAFRAAAEESGQIRDLIAKVTVALAAEKRGLAFVSRNLAEIDRSTQEPVQLAADLAATLAELKSGK